MLLDLPQITLWVAGVFFHRFYMRYSMVEERNGIHHYVRIFLFSLCHSALWSSFYLQSCSRTNRRQNIAATALFLANKTEENCRKTKEIIIAVARVAQKNSRLIIDEQSKEYWRWRDSILMYEELMLELLTFDLMIDNPYRSLFELLGQLDLAHNKTLRQAAWTFCNDACLTALPLLMEARDIAISAIFFASAHTTQQIDDVDGEPWWRFLNGDEGKCVRAIDVMRQFYTENPLRKQNPSLPSPAFLLENTRRRGQIVHSQTPPPTATPMADRSTQSPKPQANGGADRASESRDSRDPDIVMSGASQQPPSQRVNGNASPTKRKSVDSDAESEGARAAKRPRSSDDEEGEVADS